MSIRVLIADDQPIVRSGITTIIDRDPHLTVVGEAANGDEAVALTRALSPDIVLMDIRMPGRDGITATRDLGRDDKLGFVRVILLTTYDSDENVFDGLRAGASGFLLKDADPDDLRRAVHVVAGGEALLAPSVTRRLIEAYTKPGTRISGHGIETDLTPRETEVVVLAAQGLSNNEIGKHMSITVSTAKTHINRAMSKLGSHDRAQLVIAAYELGIARPGYTR